MHARQPSDPSATSGRTEIDVHIGKRVRARRLVLGLSQDDLAAALGVTQQQVKNYERGTSKVSASRLYALSNILDVSLEWFFKELVPGEGIGESASSPGESGNVPTVKAEQEEAVPQLSEDGRADREALMVLRAFRRITNSEDRKTLMSLLRRLRTDDS